MSRSGYSGELENWDLIRWRGAVTAAVKGKRGQAFLRELAHALLSLPEKKLIDGDFVRAGGVCAIGSVMVSRKLFGDLDEPQRIERIRQEFGSYDEVCGDAVGEKLGIAGALAKEIMYLNDESGWCLDTETPERRYERVLAWVQASIIKTDG